MQTVPEPRVGPPAHGLLAELRRRKVFRVAVVYGVTAWVVIQVASTLFPLLQLPEWGATLVAALTLLGFPIALVLAWALEVTPDGIRRTRSLAAVESNAPAGSPRGLRALAVVAVLGVVAGGGGYVHHRNAAEGTAGPEYRTIAVLPFANVGADPEADYFSDGITEDIMTRLAAAEELRVTSRTSVMRYKGTTKSLRQIAGELEVEVILEGTVRREGDRVRINAQLIDVSTDRYLWAESYDRELTDIFAIQSEIAQRIAEALQARLSPAARARLDVVPTQNLLAYDFYLRGRKYFHTGGDEEGAERAIANFRAALRVDSGYALAHAGLSRAYRFKSNSAGRGWLDSAVVAGKRATGLAPHLADGHAALGRAYGALGRTREALHHLEHAARRNPGDVPTLLGLGEVSADLGRLDEALRWYGRAVALEPTNGWPNKGMGSTYLALEMYEEAKRWFRRGGALQPDNPMFESGLASAYLRQDSLSLAAAHFARALARAGHTGSYYWEAALVPLLAGDAVGAVRMLEEGARLAPAGEPAHPHLGYAYLRAGRDAAARERLDHTVQWLRQRIAEGDESWGPRYQMALVAAATGDPRAARAWLEDAFTRGWRDRWSLQRLPVFAELRASGEADRLLRQVEEELERMRLRARAESAW